MMSGESWCAWLFWRTRRRWFAINFPWTMKSLMVFMFDSWTALFLLNEFWYCTQNGGSFFADRLTFLGARVFASGAILRLQMISGIFWPSDDDGSEFVVCGDELLKGIEKKRFISGAKFDQRKIPQILTKPNFHEKCSAVIFSQNLSLFSIFHLMKTNNKFHIKTDEYSNWYSREEFN